jgi:sulfur-oxidizing protein SoxY
MDALRRSILKGTGAVSAVVVAASAGLLKPGQALAAHWDAAAFESKSVEGALKIVGGSASESKDIVIKAPDIAENGAVVPVEVDAMKLPGVDRIVILAEKNVRPLITDFHLSNGALGYISTRIKMGQTANVRAVCSAGGKHYEAVKEVKVTIGGCGG